MSVEKFYRKKDIVNIIARALGTDTKPEDISAKIVKLPVYDFDLTECSGERVYLADGTELSPHLFVQDEVIDNATVEILKCQRCGEYSIGWYRNDV